PTGIPHHISEGGTSVHLPFAKPAGRCYAVYSSSSPERDPGKRAPEFRHHLGKGGSIVITITRLALAIGFTTALAATAALADEQTFFFETKPNFDNCGDGSLAKAQKEGITLGLSQNPPEAILDEKTKAASGVDWEINKGVLDWLGVKNVKVEWMPWESQIPALLSKRTDVIAGNIHVNPERVKVITF